MALHVLLDAYDAPEYAWFLALQYLADVHNLTWNKTKKCIPQTARDGHTHDISQFLQFHFWERVLFLDNVDSFPASSERPGYFVGIAHNVGDSLTFKILDDQTKQVVNVSVVRPYKDNRRVRWDPDVAFNERTSPYHLPTECYTSNINLDDPLLMDQYDRQVPDLPPSHVLSNVTNEDLEPC